MDHWFGLIESSCVLIGLLLNAYTIRQDEKARRIGNLISINEQYGHMWRELYDRPTLFRVLRKDVNLHEAPVSDEEWLFVKMIILHLDMVRRAIQAGMFVKLEGLESDVRDFISLPIPKAVWEKLKPFQNRDFVIFVESVCQSHNKTLS